MVSTHSAIVRTLANISSKSSAATEQIQTNSEAMAVLRCLAVLLIVATVSCSPRRNKDASPEHRACRDVMKPEGGREAMMTIVQTCIAEQEGLQDTIDALKEVAASEEGGRGGKRGRRGRRGKGRKGGNPIKQLENAGNTAEAETLKKCIARENGYLTDDEAETFDVEKFKTALVAKAEGSDSQANIELGINTCPDDSLTNFDVHTYMKCVMAYCATGEAPPTDVPAADEAENIEP